MDQETKEIIGEKRWIAEIVGHQGWSLVRGKIAAKIIDLQNAFNIEDGDPNTMLIDLQARKLASTMLFDFLREIESAKSEVQEIETSKKSDFVLQLE